MSKLDYEPPRKRRSFREELFAPLSPYLLVFIVIAAAVAVVWLMVVG